MKVPKPFCSLPISKLVQFLGQDGLESGYFIFVYQYLSVLLNLKEPQEERMQTSCYTDLFIGRCLGLKPKDLASQRYLSNVRHVSNFVSKNHVFLKASFKTKKKKKPNSKLIHNLVNYKNTGHKNVFEGGPLSPLSALKCSHLWCLWGRITVSFFFQDNEIYKK